MGPIFHLALAADWAAAQEVGAYTTSTRGRTLAEVGFIHASRGDQWPTVRDAFYADVTEPLLLLEIDTGRLDVPVVEEPGEPGSDETFPHIYGPLPVGAVVKAIPLPARVSGSVVPPQGPAAVAPAAPPPGPPGSSFARTFFTEMFVNAALVVLVLVTTSAGLGVGSLLGERYAILAGSVVGLIAGIVLARLLYARRHASG